VVTLSLRREATPGEALVMAEIEVGLGAVVGDVDLAMLSTGSWCPDRR
jgi:hypothetical protein